MGTLKHWKVSEGEGVSDISFKMGLKSLQLQNTTSSMASSQAHHNNQPNYLVELVLEDVELDAAIILGWYW